MPAQTEHKNNQLKIHLESRGVQVRCWCRIVVCCILLAFVSGCTSYGIIQNKPRKDVDIVESYSVITWANNKRAEDFVFVLAFSGGGTRAAAMAYGVLQELRDTLIVTGSQQERLLDKVTHSSSVSGGSFTAAYYGLHGDGTFDTFEREFLRKDVDAHLTKSLFRPVYWFSNKGRTERAIDYYNKILFHDATFADLIQPHRPMIIINASDLAHGVRFSFVQEYFNLLCSDLRSFSVARAVAASSAVPIVFNPVVIENYEGCNDIQWVSPSAEPAERDEEFSQTVKGLRSYSDKESRKYIHFVDGGITDNMGLRAMTDVMALSGGPSALISKLQRKIPRRVVFLSVNASTEHASDMDKTTKQPSMLAAMNAMSDVQLHRYNASTVDRTKESLDTWTAKMSTLETPVTSYFIQISFEETLQPKLKLFLNKISTSFSLTNEQVDTLIASARSLLRADPQFQKLLPDLARL
jgi:NTE family protein